MQLRVGLLLVRVPQHAGAVSEGEGHRRDANARQDRLHNAAVRHQSKELQQTGQQSGRSSRGPPSPPRTRRICVSSSYCCCFGERPLLRLLPPAEQTDGAMALRASFTVTRTPWPTPSPSAAGGTIALVCGVLVLFPFPPPVQRCCPRWSARDLAACLPSSPSSPSPHGAMGGT